jgi:hypothetical protein
VNAPMIVVADYSKGSEGYSYNYYVCVHLLSFFLANFYLLWVVINCYLLGYKVDKIHLNSILIPTFVDLSIFVLLVFLISL